MKMQIGRWGNSLAVRIPRELADRLNLRDGEELDSEALEAAVRQTRQQRREQALADIANARWTLPKDWKFDREEANAR